MILLALISWYFQLVSSFYALTSLAFYCLQTFSGYKGDAIDICNAVIFFIVGLFQNDYGASFLRAYDLDLPPWLGNLICLSLPLLVQLLNKLGLSWFSFLVPALLAKSPEEVLLSSLVILLVVFVAASFIVFDQNTG